MTDMIGWIIAAWLWLLSGFLVWREYASNTGERTWLGLFGLMIVGAPLITARIVWDTLVRLTKVRP